MEAHENCILTGIADSFCLPCQTYLKVDDLGVHIESSAHKKALKSTVYSEKYKDDIRKVKMGYYCEVCNVMIQTLAKVGIHVRDVSHIDNKTKRYIKPINEGVVAFDNILILKQAWHGLMDCSCVICTIDYEDENEHLNDAKHIVNLIQSKLELKKDKTIYRMIDENMISCLVCNSIITIDSKENHINEHEHLNNYSTCTQNKKCFFSQVPIDKETKKKIEPKDKERLTTKIEISSVNEDEIILCKKIVVNSFDNKVEVKSIKNDEGNFCNKEKPEGAIEISDKKGEVKSTVKGVKENSDNKDKCVSDNKHKEISENDIAMDSKFKLCKGKEKMIPDTKETHSIVKYNERQNKNYENNNDKIMTHKQVKALAKQNHMKYNKKSTYCELCDIRMSSSGNLIQEHVEEAQHKDKMEKIETRHITKTPTVKFIENEETARYNLTNFIVINNNYCITMQSYHMITKNLRCQACEVSLEANEFVSHKQNIKHTTAMHMTPILTNYKEEFIREVRPGVYHCGVCNHIEAGIEGLTKHLSSQNHLETMAIYRSIIFRRVRQAIEDKERMEFWLQLHRIMSMVDFF